MAAFNFLQTVTNISLHVHAHPMCTCMVIKFCIVVEYILTSPLVDVVFNTQLTQDIYDIVHTGTVYHAGYVLRHTTHL